MAATFAAPTVAASARKCAICSDAARGLNFGVVSCESCKAFFRRATRSGKVPVCVFSGDCPMSPLTRQFCGACRLRRCQTAGMNKSLVLSEEQRKERRLTIDVNRLIKQERANTAAGFRLQRDAQRDLDPSLPLVAGTSLSATDASANLVAADEETHAMSLPLTPTAQPYPKVASLPLSLAAEQLQLSPTDSQPRLQCCRDGRCSKCVSVVRANSDKTALKSAAAVAADIAGPRSSAVTSPCKSLELTGHDAATCDISGNARSHQQPETSCLNIFTCFSETAALLTGPRLFREEQLQQRQPVFLQAASLMPLHRRRLSTKVLNELDALARLYSTKLATARRLSLWTTLTIDVPAASSPDECRDGDLGHRLQQLTVRVSDLARACVLFAREQAAITRLPLEAQIALVKACAPTFILLCAVELYDKVLAAWIDEHGDVVPTTVIDDLESASRQESPVEAPCTATSSRIQLFELLPAVKCHIPVNAGGSCDRTVIALMQAIALLSPELVPPDLVDRDSLDVMANSAQHHIFLLRQHLETTYSFEGAAALLPKLLCSLETCKRNAACVSNLLLSCSALRNDGLLREILRARPNHVRATIVPT